VEVIRSFLRSHEGELRLRAQGHLPGSKGARGAADHDQGKQQRKARAAAWAG